MPVLLLGLLVGRDMPGKFYQVRLQDQRARPAAHPVLEPVQAGEDRQNFFGGSFHRGKMKTSLQVSSKNLGKPEVVLLIDSLFNQSLFPEPFELFKRQCVGGPS
mgnify:CR=1 FL=1